MAFSIGEHDVPERITRSRLAVLRRWHWEMPPRRLLDRLGELASEMPGVRARPPGKRSRRCTATRPAYKKLEENRPDGACRWTLQIAA